MNIKSLIRGLIKKNPSDDIKSFSNKLVHMKDFGKAEDLIFEELKAYNSDEVYTIATEFYNNLLKKNDEELKLYGSSREEIYRGLTDLEKYKTLA